jgi:hypothetical protein
VTWRNGRDERATARIALGIDFIGKTAAKLADEGQWT